MTESQLIRFLTKFTVDSVSGCWLWAASKFRGGYAQFWCEKTNRRAHRVAYEHWVGPIPIGLVIDHVKARGCVSRACVNPDHLEPVTCRVNLLRGDTLNARELTRTHCPQGHEYTSENTRLYRGGRHCRECGRQNYRDWYAQRRRVNAR